MKKYIIEILKLIGICSIIIVDWQWLETIITGQTNVNSVDSIIAIILTISVYINLILWDNK